MLKSGQNINCSFVITDPANGSVLADADALPVGTLRINGADNGATVTVTNQSTGKYKASVALPSLSAGDVVEIYITATLDSNASGAVVFSGVAETKRVSDLQDLTAAQVNAECDTAIADAGLATSAELATAQVSLDNLEAYNGNKHHWDRHANKLYIYESDGVTVKFEFDVTMLNGLITTITPV